ncbi:MAG TPA: glycosyltransferase [Dehalococcoidia bacterium]|nr:glycosyltransferase [Dehalococcoidia bacterium]
MDAREEGLDTPDLYRLLHLHPDAPRELVTEVYLHLRARAARHDAAGRDAPLRELDAAYHVLADPQRRLAYDATRAAPGGQPVPPPPAVRPDYYAALRIAPSADADIVEIAYTIRSRDRRPRAPQDGASLADARRVLANRHRRAAYDAWFAAASLDGHPELAAARADDERIVHAFLSDFGLAAPMDPPADGWIDGVVRDRPEPPAGDGAGLADGAAPRRAARGRTRPAAAPAPVRPVESVGRPDHGLARDVLVTHSILPLRRENGTLELAITRPEDAAVAHALARDVGARARISVEDRRVVQEGLARLYHAEDQREVAWGHAERSPALSARRVLTPGQMIAAALLLAALGAGLVLALVPTLITLVALCTAFYLVSSAYKMFVVLTSLTRPGEVPIDQSEIDALDERALPTYTLLLPLYREANVLQSLLTGIAALDYPADKLDVKLLLEPDDAETLAAVNEADLPSFYHKLIVPRDGPKAKPKALNYGLLHARGEYCTIYDAEDRPEPDQLKKAVIAFRKSSDRVGCIQAKLNFYNRDQNMLTRWFTADYSQWFDLYLPGLTGAGAPIPLGGTSNHFPTALLREIGGWDPYNVTEDADLGIRLARSGWKTAMIDSVTYEEANSRLGNWLRQRSHWIKGYMLTWLVHMRNPLRLWRDLGTHGFLSVQLTVAGSVFGYFANPVFWALIAVWYTVHWSVVQTLYPTPVLYLATLALFVGNCTFVYVAMAGCVKREFYGGVKYALLIPLYWSLMTVSAFHALYQLVRKPHYWEKTVHGLAPEAPGRLSPEAAG